MAATPLKTKVHLDGISAARRALSLPSSGWEGPWVCLCLGQRVALSFAVGPENFLGLLDISRAAASPSDLALCPARCLVYILHQGFCDT